MKTRLLIFLFLVNIVTLYSLEGEKPLWLLMDEGITAVESGDLGRAVYIFRDVLKHDSNNPEALKWLGYVFEKEGEFEIAQKQYEKALENRKNLEILEDNYYIMYHLADLYRRMGKTDESRSMLNRIINETPAEKYNYNQETAMVKLLEEKGPDTFFQLYRPESRITLEAHRRLGEDYYSSKKYNESLLHLVYSFGTPVSFAIEEIKKNDPDYSFSKAGRSGDFERLLQMVSRNNRLKAYFKEVHFFNTLLITGKCLYESGFKEKGIGILTLVYNYSPDIITRNKAARFYTQIP